MKRSVLIFGIAMIALLSAGDLAAQRGRSQDRDRGDRDRREERSQRDRNGQNRDGYRNNDRRGDRGTYRGNDRGYRNRNGRSERVVAHRRVRYDGYRNYGYPRRGGRYTVVYDYDYRNGRRFRINRAPRPTVRHIWVNGHWRFSRRLQRDVWVDGRWVVKARHHRWVDGHYERFRGRRTWVPGCWVRIY